MCNFGIRWLLFVTLVPFLMGFCIRSQGIKGHVLIEKDATMPLKGKTKQIGRPISTIVYVYEATEINRLIDQQGNFARGVDAKLIKQIRSDESGKYKLRLNPGKYTIVLGYKEGIYIPFFSGNTGVAFVEVLKHQYQEIDLTIIASSVF
ncbi:MAG: hypothetical protein ACKOWO_09100 [Sediminibacterium sp.]